MSASIVVTNLDGSVETIAVNVDDVISDASSLMVSFTDTKSAMFVNLNAYRIVSVEVEEE